jgi:phosphatidylserine/phosphatidylglycerophosphate/cardiolipin synthase-like enzyme
MNVGDEYAGGSRTAAGKGRGGRNRPWHDAHLRLEGPAVLDLATVFVEDWTFASGQRLVGSATLLDERFTGDLARSREMTLAVVERRGSVERARPGLARLLAPLL